MLKYPHADIKDYNDFMKAFVDVHNLRSLGCESHCGFLLKLQYFL